MRAYIKREDLEKVVTIKNLIVLFGGKPSEEFREMARRIYDIGFLEYERYGNVADCLRKKLNEGLHPSEVKEVKNLLAEIREFREDLSRGLDSLFKGLIELD